jgi:hypothetical protein
MHMKSCSIKEKGIEVVWLDEAREGRETKLPVDPDHPLARPLPEFDKALQALGPVALRMIDGLVTQKTWTAKKGRVHRVFVGYNKYGARSVKLEVTFTLCGGREWKLKSPTLRMDDAVDGEKNILIEVEDKDIASVEAFLAEALNYADGERAQGEFFQAADPDDDGGQGELV